MTTSTRSTSGTGWGCGVRGLTWRTAGKKSWCFLLVSLAPPQPLYLLYSSRSLIISMKERLQLSGRPAPSLRGCFAKQATRACASTSSPMAVECVALDQSGPCARRTVPYIAHQCSHARRLCVGRSAMLKGSTVLVKYGTSGHEKNKSSEQDMNKKAVWGSSRNAMLESQLF